MLALARACRDGRVPGEVRVVVAPADEAPGGLNARKEGLTVKVVAPGDGYGERLLSALEGVDWVCLAGYMRLLPDEVLRAFPDRILNVHPALLPEFGGKGMYGARVHAAVIAAGRKESGCTVHLVNEHYDEGRILLQRRVPVLPEDTPETLAARILDQEHIAYAEALRNEITAARR